MLAILCVLFECHDVFLTFEVGVAFLLGAVIPPMDDDGSNMDERFFLLNAFVFLRWLMFGSSLLKSPQYVRIPMQFPGCVFRVSVFVAFGCKFPDFKHVGKLELLRPDGLFSVARSC